MTFVYVGPVTNRSPIFSNREYASFPARASETLKPVSLARATVVGSTEVKPAGERARESVGSA